MKNKIILVGMVAIFSILVLNLIYAASDCKNLYYVDDNNRECNQKQFCGTYMYRGLYTFENKTDCENYALASSGGSVNPIVGNDSDSHGCKASAGYSWCETKGKCLRNWEENCSNDKKLDIDYTCSIDSDCVSQCKNGCVNQLWAKENPDTSECLRAWTCSCVDNTCYKDGKPQKDNLQEDKNNTFPGEGKVKILPEEASQRARERLGDLGFNVTLKDVGQNKTEYIAVAEKQGKFFGIFKTKANVSVEIDAQTGEVIKVHKPWWSFLAGI